MAALDPDSDVDTVQLESGAEELKARLEVLLGARPEAFADKTEEKKAQESAALQQHRERVAAAGGELLGAALQFLGELVAGAEGRPGAAPQVVNDLRSRLEQCVEEEGTGRLRFAVTLPNRSALEAMAQTLASFLVASDSGVSALRS